MKELFLRVDAKKESPIKFGSYDTDKGKLWWLPINKAWSCRNDRLSNEYPSVWYKEVEQQEQQKELKDRLELEILNYLKYKGIKEDVANIISIGVWEIIIFNKHKQ